MPDNIGTVLTQLRHFVAERDWEQFHDPKNLTMLLASEVGELVSTLRWVTNAEVAGYVSQPGVRSRVSDEIGDVGIAVLLLCDRVGIDFTDAVLAKLEKNRTSYPAETARGRADRP